MRLYPASPQSLGVRTPKTSEGTQGPQPIEMRLLIVPAAFLNTFENLFAGQWTAELDTRNIKR